MEVRAVDVLKAERLERGRYKECSNLVMATQVLGGVECDVYRLSLIRSPINRYVGRATTAGEVSDHPIPETNAMIPPSMEQLIGPADNTNSSKCHAATR